MSLNSEMREEIRDYLDILQKNKEQLTKDEQKLIGEKIEKYLNRDRELRPKEERLIKKAAKRYNIFISIIAAIGILGSIGAISISSHLYMEWKSISMEKAIKQAEKDTENAIKKAIKSTKEGIQELEKETDRQLEDALKDARNETNNYKNFAIESMAAMNDRFRDIFEEVISEAAKADQLTVELIKLKNRSEDLEQGLNAKLEKSEQMSTRLNGLLKELEDEDKLVNEFEDLFEILKSKDSNQLIFRKDNEKQFSFGIGELLIVFGRDKNDRKGDTVNVDFGERKFNSKDEMFLSVNGIAKNKNSYAIVKGVNPAGFSCKFISKVSGLGGYNKVGNAHFNYIAIGKAAPAKSPEAEKGHE